MSGNSARGLGKSSNKVRSGSSRYGLRTKSESSAVSTPKDNIYLSPIKPEVTPISTTPSTPSSKICTICKGIDDFRSLKFKDAITEFTDKIDAFKDLITKSIDDKNSTLSHALDTIKHFIIHVDPKKVNESFDKIDCGLTTLCNEVASLPNTAYIKDRLEVIEGRLYDLTELNSKLDALCAKLPDSAELDSRLNALENRLSELTNMDNKPIALNGGLSELSNFTAKLESFDDFVDDKIRSINSSTNSINNLTEQVSKIDLLCTQINSKLESTNIQNTRPLPSLPISSNDNSTHIHNYNAPNPKTCLILGDSNTKYIKLDDNQLLSHRIPTYLIEDIDPKTCFGYKKIWIHVGTNNIKSIRCSSTNDIYRHFNIFMQKISSIRSICPHSKIIVSPIPPTAIQALNRRAIIFNRLLFSQKPFFSTLDFNMFCGSDDKLMTIYRCYNNKEDKIHFGSLGIKILTSKVKHSFLHLDQRSYASAATQY